MGDVAKISQWSVAWICSFIYFLLLGVARLSGLLYLAAIGRYNADRSQASLPFVLCYTVRNVAGPLIGYLGRKVEIRLLTACGCFLSAVGAGACFLAEDITTVSILWGGVFGIGFGLGSILLPEILNQHFDKYIANANGIALGGECVAGFVLPVFVEFLLDTYGTSGTFLILSGLILHGVPAALLLKSPSRAKHGISQPEQNRNADGGQYSAVACVCDEDYCGGNMSDTHAIKRSCDVRDGCNHTDHQVGFLKETSGNSEGFNYSKESYSVTDSLVQCRHGSLLRKDYEASNILLHTDFHGNSSESESTQSPTLQMATNHCSCNNCYTTLSPISHIKDSSCLRNCTNSMKQTRKYPENQPTDKGTLHYSTSNHCSAILSPERKSHEESSKHSHNIQPTAPTATDPIHSYTTNAPHVHSITTTKSSAPSSSFHSKESPPVHPKESPSFHPKESPFHPKESPSFHPKESPPSPFCVFLDPAFLLILFTQSSMIFIFTTIMTIIVDFSRDAGVMAHQEVYILMCLSVSDMLGRFGLGWVTDAEYMGSVSFSALCYAGSGSVMVSLVFLRGFGMVMVAAFLIGLFLGGLLIVCPGIVLDHIEEDQVTMALASRFVLYAPMSLTQSLLIGFFREKLGSYDGLFYLLAVHCFICCAFSLIVPLASRCRDRRKTITDNSIQSQ